MRQLAEYRAPTELKLSALWAATMFCYVYGDYFGLYAPGSLAEMNRGIMGPLGRATPGVLVGVSIMMALPSAMVALSLLLRPAINRWTNVILGIVYSLIMILTMMRAPPFYILLGVIEVSLTLAITVIALRWPVVEPTGDTHDA